MLICAAASLVLARAPAVAADIQFKAPVVPAAPAWSWTGLHAGASLGARWADNDWTSTNIFPIAPPGALLQPVAGGAMDSVAPRIAGYVGYDWQVAPRWVAGIEADIGWANNSRTAAPAPGTAGLSGPACGGGTCLAPPTANVQEGWDASLRGRIGMLVRPDTLVFTTAGVAWQRVVISAACVGSVVQTNFCTVSETGSASSTLTGWTAGVGVEQRFFANWLARVDYRFADFGTFSHQFFTLFGPGNDSRFTGNVKVVTHTFEIGLAYKFP